jgi:hypothetical protein
MQFRVPQFIDIEDKILGPLTWKQFAYCLGAAGTAYIGIKIVGSTVIGLIVSAPVYGFFLALAFLKVNGRSFLDMLSSIVRYFTGSNTYTWQKKDQIVSKNEIGDKKAEQITEPKIKYNRNSLKDLAYGLDINPREDTER